MFKTVFRYSLLTTYRQKAVLFWSLAFPLVMSIFFFFAFGNIGAFAKFTEPIKVAYVAPQTRNPFYNLRQILSDIPMSEGSEARLFELQEVKEEEARELVNTNQVTAAVLDLDPPVLLADKVSIKQVVVKQVVEQIHATKTTLTSLAKQQPAAALQTMGQGLNTAEYTRKIPINEGRMGEDILYYFALLAMVSLGACSAGAMVIISQQANKSQEGARVSITPANKWLRVAAAGLASYLVQLVLSLTILAFLTLVLKKIPLDIVPYLSLLISVGTLTGFLMGMAIACMVNGSMNVILSVTTSAYLFSSFLSGLMSHYVQRLVDTKVAWLSAINPGSMMVKSMYSMFYYQKANHSYLLHMLIACLLFSILVVLTLRRRYHDSI
ncbi:MAG: ABC transporter permease [Clostridiales bacterium]|nr:ABC transporter permease [Clostridiales bacterium]